VSESKTSHLIKKTIRNFPFVIRHQSAKIFRSDFGDEKMANHKWKITNVFLKAPANHE